MSLIYKQFSDKLMKLLVAASLLSIIAQIASDHYEHGFLQGFSILFTVFTITFISGLSEYRCTKNLSKYGDELSCLTTGVYRGTKNPFTIPNTEIVVGDIIKIDKGMILPADCILIQSGHPRQDTIDSKSNKQKAMKCSSEIVLANEKDITGIDNYKPKVPINFKSVEDYNKALKDCETKKEIDNVLFAGSYIASGEGVALVCAVGHYTQQGMFMHNYFSRGTMNISDDLKITSILESYLSIYTGYAYIFTVFLIVEAFIMRFFVQDHG